MKLGDPSDHLLSGGMTWRPKYSVPGAKNSFTARPPSYKIGFESATRVRGTTTGFSSWRSDIVTDAENLTITVEQWRGAKNKTVFGKFELAWL